MLGKRQAAVNAGAVVDVDLVGRFGAGDAGRFGRSSGPAPRFLFPKTQVSLFFSLLFVFREIYVSPSILWAIARFVLNRLPVFLGNPTANTAGDARWMFHFTPTSASWLNAVEGFFAKLTRQRLQRGVFRSVVDLQLAINRFVADTNADPKPFAWTADPKRVLAAVKRGKQTLESVH